MVMDFTMSTSGAGSLVLRRAIAFLDRFLFGQAEPEARSSASKATRSQQLRKRRWSSFGLDDRTHTYIRVDASLDYRVNRNGGSLAGAPIILKSMALPP